MKSFRLLMLLAGFFVSGIPGWAQSNSTSPESQRQPQEIQAVPRQAETEKAVLETSAPNAPATLGRAIVFVHGWCGNDVSWLPTAQTLRDQLMAANPTLYKNGQIYGAFFRGFNGGVQFYDLQTFNSIQQSQIPPTARFFVIELIDPRQSGSTAPFDATNVAQIPISVKANELSEVLSSIQDITFVQDGIVVAHSMGGLVARAYIENLGSPLTFGNGQYHYSPGTTLFFPNLGSLVTIDSPHGGAPVSVSESLFGFLFTCGGLNRNEMIPGDSHSVIETLNYVPNAALLGATAASIPSIVPVRSIKSYTTFDWGGTPNSDGILNSDTQDIRSTLQPHYQLTNNLATLDNWMGPYPTGPFSSGCDKVFLLLSYFILHPIECVGIQNSTLQFVLNGINADLLGVPLGVSSLSLLSSIVGGLSTSGSIGLTTGAPAHGASVTLSSDDLSAQVPTVVNIPAGVNSATFNLNSSSVSSPKTVHISASYGRGTQQVALLVNPAMAQVGLSSNALNFNTQLLGTRGIGQVVALNNSGTAALTIANIAANGDFLQSNNCPQIVVIGASCAINILFKPAALGLRTGTLTITDNAPGSPHVVSLSGSGFDLVLTIGRPARPHRTPNGSSNVQKTNIILSSVGARVIGTVSLSCQGPNKTDFCKISQQAEGDALNVEFELRSRRSSRLNSRPLSENVTIRADIGNANRTFSVPVH